MKNQLSFVKIVFQIILKHLKLHYRTTVSKKDTGLSHLL